ncbi:MAG: glutaredoxin family protein [Actinomycetia bacterium]|nr:glutaredoxin family protein [Actinomycetes bacterium]
MDVIVYTRQGCPLCEKGIARARDVYGDDAVTLIDVDLDLALLERYSDRVPVIESRNGVVIDEGIIDIEKLRPFRES